MPEIVLFSYLYCTTSTLRRSGSTCDTGGRPTRHSSTATRRTARVSPCRACCSLCSNTTRSPSATCASCRRLRTRSASRLPRWPPRTCPPRAPARCRSRPPTDASIPSHCHRRRAHRLTRAIIEHIYTMYYVYLFERMTIDYNTVFAEIVEHEDLMKNNAFVPC